MNKQKNYNSYDLKIQKVKKEMNPDRIFFTFSHSRNINSQISLFSFDKILFVKIECITTILGRIIKK